MICGMSRTSPSVELSAADQMRLQQWQSAHGTPQQVALRCRLVLAAAAGQQDLAIASACGVNRHTAALWRRRVLEAGIDAVWETKAGRGRKPQYDLSQRDALIAATLQTKPKGMTHWSCRLMANAQGVSKNTVNRLWQLHNLKPHLSRTFKLSRDSKFVEKLTDVVGLQYVLLPENINYLMDAIKRIREAGINYFVIKPFVQQSHLQSYHMKEQFNLNKIEDTLNQAESLSGENFSVIARRASFENYGKRKYRHCYGTAFISVLNSSGDIASCLPYWDRKEFVFGNIHENTFQEIWFGDRRKKIKKYLENELDAPELCPPNCRPNAINGFLWEIKNPSVKHINFV